MKAPRQLPPPAQEAGGEGARSARVRVQNRQARNARLRADFAELWTNAPRPRVLSREAVLAQLAATYCLALTTVEDIVYKSAPAGQTPAPAPAPPASVGELVQRVRAALAVVAQRLAELEDKLGEAA